MVIFGIILIVVCSLLVILNIIMGSITHALIMSVLLVINIVLLKLNMERKKK